MSQKTLPVSEAVWELLGCIANVEVADLTAVVVIRFGQPTWVLSQQLLPDFIRSLTVGCKAGKMFYPSCPVQWLEHCDVNRLKTGQFNPVDPRWEVIVHDGRDFGLNGKVVVYHEVLQRMK